MKVKSKDIVNLVVAGVIFAVISQIVHLVEALATMSYYTNPDYFGTWSRFMMPDAGPPPVRFFVMSFILNIIVGMVFAVFYEMTKSLLPKGSIWSKAAVFALVLFVVSIIPSSFSMLLLINLPVALILIWAFTGAIVYYLSALVFLKLLS